MNFSANGTITAEFKKKNTSYTLDVSIRNINPQGYDVVFYLRPAPGAAVQVKFVAKYKLSDLRYRYENRTIELNVSNMFRQTVRFNAASGDSFYDFDVSEFALSPSHIEGNNIVINKRER